MHAPKRRFEPAVIERLFAQPYRFQYFQAVRMIAICRSFTGRLLLLSKWMLSGEKAFASPG